MVICKAKHAAALLLTVAIAACAAPGASPSGSARVLRSGSATLAPYTSDSFLPATASTTTPTPTPAPATPHATPTPAPIVANGLTLPYYVDLPDEPPVPLTSAELDARLSAWLSGSTPLGKTFWSLGPTRFGAIDAAGVPLKQEDQGALYQGLLLGEETVDDHLIAYFGMQDGIDGRFYLPVNIGDLRHPTYSCFPYIVLAGDETGIDYPGWKQEYRRWYLRLEDCDHWLRASNGLTFMFTLVINRTGWTSSPYYSLPEAKAGESITTSFVRWSNGLALRKTTLAADPPTGRVNMLVDRRVSSFDATLLPFPEEFDRYGAT